MRSSIDPIDARLLEILQRDFPLVPRPFEAIAAALEITAEDVMERIQRLKRDRIIRQISAIFDSAALGYKSSLVAFKIPPEMIDTVAERVSAHPGVSHCYSRDADFNLWFTITVPPETDLDRDIRDLAETPGVAGFLSLPTLKVFKIGVFLDVTGENTPGRDKTKETRPKPVQNKPELDDKIRTAIRVLQRDLPIITMPFSQLADDADMAESDLLSTAISLISTGVMRRFAAVLRHTNAGFRANAMVCWSANQAQIDPAGEILASHPSVSHCYQRLTSPAWPYPLYTMVHARTEEELLSTISTLSASSGLRDYRILRTIKEYKKSRVTYFEAES